MGVFIHREVFTNGRCIFCKQHPVLFAAAAALSCSCTPTTYSARVWCRLYRKLAETRALPRGLVRPAEPGGCCNTSRLWRLASFRSLPGGQVKGKDKKWVGTELCMAQCLCASSIAFLWPDACNVCTVGLSYSNVVESMCLVAGQSYSTHWPTESRLPSRPHPCTHKRPCVQVNMLLGVWVFEGGVTHTRRIGMIASPWWLMQKYLLFLYGAHIATNLNFPT